MPKFNVKLTAVADVETVVEVEAETKEAAEKAALADTGNCIWKYCGVNDPTTVDVCEVSEVEEPTAVVAVDENKMTRCGERVMLAVSLNDEMPEYSDESLGWVDDMAKIPVGTVGIVKERLPGYCAVEFTGHGRLFFLAPAHVKKVTA